MFYLLWKCIKVKSWALSTFDNYGNVQSHMHGHMGSVSHLISSLCPSFFHCLIWWTVWTLLVSLSHFSWSPTLLVCFFSWFEIIIMHIEYYNGTSLLHTSLGQKKVSLCERCPHFRGCHIQTSLEMRPEDVSLLERCPHFGVSWMERFHCSLKAWHCSLKAWHVLP